LTAKVVFLWHMHQPDYRDPESGRPLLPWVRMHASRSYTDMADALLRHPAVRAVVNWAPCLLLQLEEYVSGRARDYDEELARKPASSLNAIERMHVLAQGFSVDWDRWVRPVPRYAELLKKRGEELKEIDLAKVQELFSAEELTDLQVHYVLGWMGFTARRDESLVQQLLLKDKGFTEDEKLRLLDLQQQIAARVLGLWRKLRERGQIEITCSPLFHPILPLLVDTDAARRALPQLPLPPRFQYPQDALLQVTRGLDVTERSFGERPVGMWPSEGSVSPEVIEMLAGAGLRWCATDQRILERSQVRVESGARGPLHLRPWSAGSAEKPFTMLFRDQDLADSIGFRYSRARAEDAAQDLVGKLVAMGASGDEPLVTIALDGENAWEHYPLSGLPFLDALYQRLESETRVRTVLPRAELQAAPRDQILRLHSGSWIESSYRIWIGHPEDNAGWTLLGAARAQVAQAFAEGKLPLAQLEKARDALLPAEGSDWFWWYGDDFKTDNAAEFDSLFRRHVAAAWLALGKTPPEELGRPIIPPNKDASVALDLLEPARRLIEPSIDGEARGYFEWTGAGTYRPGRALGGSMHQGATGFTALWFGFGKGALYLRLDPRDARDLSAGSSSLRIHLLRARTGPSPSPGWEHPESNAMEQRELSFQIAAGGASGRDEPVLDAQQSPCGHGRSGAIVELAVQLSTLGLEPQARFGLLVRVLRGETELERLPRYGEIALAVPGLGFEAAHWQV
jgi:alpha-amylase/alpha-mannosidase (GH57 family)